SRVPGAPPFTSTDPVVPGGHRTTVHPVIPARSVTWPTRIPATRVITPAPRVRSCALPSTPARPEHVGGERGQTPVELLVRLHHREVAGAGDHLAAAPGGLPRGGHRGRRRRHPILLAHQDHRRDGNVAHRVAEI